MPINNKKSLLESTLLTALLTAGLWMAAPAVSFASVEVDLSVLDGDAGTSATDRNGLKMPGTVYPRSEYIGPPVEVSEPTPTPVPAPTPEPVQAQEPVAPAAATVSAQPETVVPEPAAAPEPPSALLETATETASAPEPPTSTAADEPQPIAPPPEPAALDVTPTPSATAAVSDDGKAQETASEETVQSTIETASTGSQASSGITRIVFTGEDTRLPEGAASMLDPLASEASGNDNIRIQLRAFAGGEDISASKARRLSLSRALAVRSYLIEQGVRSTRIDVRALGDKSDESPINRVDIEAGTP